MRVCLLIVITRNDRYDKYTVIMTKVVAFVLSYADGTDAAAGLNFIYFYFTIKCK